ncbi:MAG: DUF2452 domain-containing protein [Abyssibacter sp.]|uniref:DUF2452 domain-containing protein n=1 Tax=Abyssibacter sp. TaxID=2320200 RepID=UPI0032196605
MPKHPNPQGKGLVPVLADLSQHRGQWLAAPAKAVEQVSAELFTSLFVLGSQFGFRPVVGRTYFLYRKPDKFWLSMLGPEHWSEAVAGVFIGRCILQNDMTWTLALSDAASTDTAFMQQLDEARADFDTRLRQAAQVEDALPEFARERSYYKRVLSFALGHSLGASLSRAGLAGLSYDQACAALGHASKDAPCAGHRAVTGNG